MKQIEFVNPNKMEINTGHKTFDRQCDCLFYGNVIGNTQYGNYIRPYEETDENRFPPGELQRSDCRQFVEAFAAPKNVIASAKQLSNEFGGCILYAIFHTYKRERIVHGFICSKTHEFDYEYVWTTYCRNDTKSMLLLKEVARYITNDPHNLLGD